MVMKLHDDGHEDCSLHWRVESVAKWQWWLNYTMDDNYTMGIPRQQSGLVIKIWDEMIANELMNSLFRIKN